MVKAELYIKMHEKFSVKELVITIVDDLTYQFSFAYGISSHWPFSNNYLIEYCNKEFLENLNKFIKIINKGYFKEEGIKRVFQYPSEISQWYYMLGSANKILKKEDKYLIALTLLKFISHLRKDPYCKNKDNIIKNIKIPNFKDVEDTVSLRNRLVFVLEMYVELLAPTVMPLLREISGPYFFNNKIIIIREYHDLVRDLSKEEKINLPEKIVIFELYDNSNYEKVDFFNHVLNTEKVFSKEVYVQLNGEFIGELKIKLLIDNIVNYIDKKKKSLTKIEALRNFIISYFNSLKKFANLIGKDISINSMSSLKKLEKETLLEEKGEWDFHKISKEEIKSSLMEGFSNACGIGKM